MSIKNHNKAYLRLYLISLIGITLIFIVFGYSILTGFKQEQLDTMMEHSITIADQYSYTLSKSVEAGEVINDLLIQQITSAGKTLTKITNWTDVDLEELAKALEMDILNVYDQKGVIIGSMDEFNIGFKANDNHPVVQFILSQDDFQMDSFESTENSGSHYKYAYFKLPKQHIVQIGILQHRIQDFVQSTEIETTLNRIKTDEAYEYLSFIDTENIIKISTEKAKIGQKIIDEKIITLINQNDRGGVLLDTSSGKVYEVLVPVYRGDEKIGTLSLAQNISTTENIIKRMSTVSIWVIIIIYGIFLFLITSTHKKSKELVGLAYFDQLTGLPNFQYLKEKMSDNLPNTENQKKALILVNCTNFKLINMLLGYDLGDGLISEMGKKINTLANEKVTVARFTADRFLIYMENYQDRTEVLSLVNKIDTLFKEPLRLENTIKYLSIQYGITEFYETDKSMDQLLKEVMVTIGTLSSSDDVNYAFFTYNTGRKLQLHETIESDLRSVLNDDTDSNSSLYLLYQPIFSLKDGEVIGFEALSRLVSPKYGEIPPLVFIEVAEKKKLIEPLGNLIFTKACQYARRLDERGFGHLSISINISGLQILQENFIEMVKSTLKAQKVDPHRLTLEITESVFMDSLDLVNAKMEQLRSMGIEIALDDFGTGYSSLSRLKSLSVDTLKIDQSFIRPITHEDNERHIAKDIISMAHRTGLKVVAEGVETEDQILYLIRNNCDQIQGYYCGKPMREEDANLILLGDSCQDLHKVIERLNWNSSLEE